MFNRILSIVMKRKPVEYDATFFDAGWFENWKQLRHVLWTLLQSRPHWRRILDFGCGPGVMIDFMNDKGYQYYGWDNSDQARRLYHHHFGRYGDRFLRSLDQCNPHQFDLLLSFDVFEHMSDQSISKILMHLDGISNFMFNISRSRSIPGHINIKNDRQWIDFFSQNGLRYDKAATAEFRSEYLRIRPQASDMWHRNLFIFSR